MYGEYFWTELTYERHSYVAPSGEILIHVNYDGPSRTYRVEDKEFINLNSAKSFAVAALRRTGKIPDDDPTEEPT